MVGVEEGDVAVGGPSEEALDADDRRNREQVQQRARARPRGAIAERNTYRVRARRDEEIEDAQAVAHQDGLLR